MPRTTERPYDPLGTILDERIARVRRRREAGNVLGSYHRATDLLAELLQNATDAIDTRSAKHKGAPRRIRIRFDAAERSIAVTDTGTGLNGEALQLVFQPNITLKDGELEIPSDAQRRGEKGIGLSFLLFSSDLLRLRTCDGNDRHDVVVEGAGTWATSEENVRYTASLDRNDPDELLDSTTYTQITLGGIDPGRRLDRDLFAMSVDEVEWTLRTLTAVGNTAVLFQGLRGAAPQKIDVTLDFTPAPDYPGDKEPRKPAAMKPVIRRVPYRYATPEDLLARARRLRVHEEVPVHEFEDLAGLKVTRLRRLLLDGAMRYVAADQISGREIPTYAFAMEGNRMNRVLRALAKHPKVTWVPEEWQGFWVATKGMPTGVRLTGGVLPTRTYEARVFMLMEREDLKLDMGRKTLAGGAVRGFNRIIRDTWNDDLRYVVERFPRPRRNPSATTLEIDRRARDILKLERIDDGLPLLRAPDRTATVAALFHEVLAREATPLPSIRPLLSDVFDATDGLVYVGPHDDGRPLHVLFALDQVELLEKFSSGGIEAEVVDLAVVWHIHDGDDEGERIGVSDADEGPDGATHFLVFAGLGGRERDLRTIVLSDLVETVV